jgi:hypothetical protein
MLARRSSANGPKRAVNLCGPTLPPGAAVRVLKNKKKGGLAMRAMLEVSTDYGYDVAIYEGDLEGITASELWKLRISRPVLKRCFGEGVMLMQGKTENDRVRLCAYPILGANNGWSTWCSIRGGVIRSWRVWRRVSLSPNALAKRAAWRGSRRCIGPHRG